MFCAVSVDRLFDKPIIYYTENVKTLSIGSWGCNFRCPGCQNAGLSWSETGLGIGAVELNPDQIIDLAKENCCRGICYTYNEPAILLESIEKIAGKARENGLFNILVTNSTLTVKSAQRIARYTDAVAADIKSLEDAFFYAYCGAKGIPNVTRKILDCIRTFHEAGCHLEIRTNIIPGGNDREENLHGIASWIRVNLGSEIPWHVTRFFPANKLMDIGRTPIRILLKAQQIGLDEGLKYVLPHFSKGCDCAGEKQMIGSQGETNPLQFHPCCKKSFSAFKDIIAFKDQSSFGRSETSC